MNDIKFRLSEKIKQLYETTTPQEFNQKVTELISEYDVTPVKTKSGEGDILIRMDYFLSAFSTYYGYAFTSIGCWFDYGSNVIRSQ